MRGYGFRSQGDEEGNKQWSSFVIRPLKPRKRGRKPKPKNN